MLSSVIAGPFSVRGVSVAGIYTSLFVQELGVVLDAGITLRSAAKYENIFISHGHGDHLSGLASLMGTRDLMGLKTARIFLPTQIRDAVENMLKVSSELYRFDLNIELIPLTDGDTVKVNRDIFVRAFRTHHTVPSLGYQFLRRTKKLRPEFLTLPPQEIAARRTARDDSLFTEVEQLELAYATDTNSDVFDSAPYILESRVLICECTYTSPDKSPAMAKLRGHMHLDDLVARLPQMKNQHVVLMHGSQSEGTKEVRNRIFDRLEAGTDKGPIVQSFGTESNDWFG